MPEGDKKDDKKSGEEGEGSGKNKPRNHEYNPLWLAYLFIALSSLINLSSASNIQQNGDGSWAFGVAIGSSTFGMTMLILILDRSKWLSNVFDYTKACDGNFEGFFLIFLTLWWIVGVSYLTQVNGMAYFSLNVYFSSWMTLAACIYTLNLWSTNKDILSLDEITGVSETLKSWYILLLASLVVSGTCLEMATQVYDSKKNDAFFGFALGAASTLLSLFWILVHYNFLEFCHEGGLLEFCCSIFAILLWIVGTAVLTQEGGIGATIVGFGCQLSKDALSVPLDEATNCSIVYFFDDGESSEATNNVECDAVLSSREVPGSNIYAAVWTCMGASLHIALRWKAQQAIQFAQAANMAGRRGDSASDADGDIDGDDVDLDEYEDAEVY